MAAWRIGADGKCGSLTVLLDPGAGVYVCVGSLRALWIREPGVYVYVYVWESLERLR